MESSDHVRLTWGQFLRGYTAIILSGLALALVLERWWGIDGYRTIWVSGGILFCTLSSGRPRFWYAVVRNTGWFAFVPEEPMRPLLAFLGLVLLIGGLLLPAAALRD